MSTSDPTTGTTNDKVELTDEELDGFVPLPDPLPIGSELAEPYGSWADGLGSETRLALTIAAAAWMSSSSSSSWTTSLPAATSSPSTCRCPTRLAA